MIMSLAAQGELEPFSPLERSCCDRAELLLLPACERASESERAAPDRVTAASPLPNNRSGRREVRPLRAWLLCNKGKLTGGKFEGIRSCERAREREIPTRGTRWNTELRSDALR